jgi:hypothetical protein
VLVLCALSVYREYSMTEHVRWLKSPRRQGERGENKLERSIAQHAADHLVICGYKIFHVGCEA